MSANEEATGIYSVALLLLIEEIVVWYMIWEGEREKHAVNYRPEGLYFICMGHR